MAAVGLSRHLSGPPANVLIPKTAMDAPLARKQILRCPQDDITERLAPNR
jgi:hypothetical protein